MRSRTVGAIHDEPKSRHLQTGRNNLHEPLQVILN